MVCFMVMDVMISINSLQIPTRHTLADLNWFTVCIANATWVWTMGIPFGLAAVIVAYSSPITALREKADVVEEFDY